ncbi:hypothetical protein C8J36_114110 [Rhizobium sp. PP-F2F-G48]|uniref:DUF2255 family protein n=1 Tax=Rhizobium sp. PP-F2F-G48 TaxID=2135651 RepID=UPI001044E4DC|nr:DUF2255 family protein [Rhizobium sp. PP-F2F-G48]TCM48410.1 hypothetical protein C8J36_114110 [Rhizobium sp. PP-F2F-G48]
MAWSNEELGTIGGSDDLHISPFRGDGIILGTPTWIWSVVVDGELYVRGYNGQASRWYQAAVAQGAGRVSVAGMTRDVTFTTVEEPINDLIDYAYRVKYAKSQYLKPMISARARAATIKITPENS